MAAGCKPVFALKQIDSSIHRTLAVEAVIESYWLLTSFSFFPFNFTYLVSIFSFFSFFNLQIKTRLIVGYPLLFYHKVQIKTSTAFFRFDGPN